MANAEARVMEASRLGFTRILVPEHNLKGLSSVSGIQVVGVRTLRDAYEQL